MGGNLQKGKTQDGDGSKKGEVQLLLSVKDKDLKEKENLGTARWFYTTQYLSWELYNNLSNEDKEKTVFWTIYPLEISNEIERAYINKFPYEKNNKIIFFDNLQQKHVLLCNKDDTFIHYGLVKRDIPSNKFIIKNENNFLENYQKFLLLDNSVNAFQYNLINDLAMICYEHIFSFFSFDMSDDLLIKNFLSTTIICSRRLYDFINFEYQEYIKFNFIKFKNYPFSLVTLRAMLLFDFEKEPIYLNYFLNNLDEKNFDVIIMNMFLESSNFSHKILGFSSTCSKKTAQYTTFYLCLLYILLSKKKEKNNDNFFSDELSENDSSSNNIKIIKKSSETSEKNLKIPETKKEMTKTYFYIPEKHINNYSTNNYYSSPNFLITSKNKFNNILSLDKTQNNKFIEIEIRIPPKFYKANLHPIFNMDELELDNYSLYNQQNIVFSANSVFKCLYIDKSTKKIIFKFIREATWNPLLYLTRETKKFFGVMEDGFRYLTEEQRKQIFLARVKNKEIKFIYGLSNLHELEIYDDSEPKTDINTLTSYFNQFKKLKCLTIVGNNMSNKDCTSLSNGLKFLKHLRILNLSFNSLNDNNILKISFNTQNKLEVLNLKCNNATEQSLETFKEELSKLKNLKEFNILDNQINDQGFNHILNAFLSIPDLRILNVSNCNISNNGIKKMNGLINTNENFLRKLEIINLSGNAINDDCINCLISIMKKLPFIKKFSIAQSQISCKGLNLVYNILKKEINKFWYFDLNGGWFVLMDKFDQDENNFDKINKLNDMPVIFGDIKINYLKRSRKKLANKTHFDFSNSKIRNKNLMAYLEKELVFFPNLKTINLSFIYNITLPGYEALCEGFKKLPNLSKLILSSNNISDKAFEYIYNIFDKCKNFSYIDMSVNNITSSGFTNFCLSLTKNDIKIKEIDFYCNKINNDGFKTLCEEAKNNTFIYLQKLNLSKNLLGNESMKDFSVFYPKFESLVEADFSYNNLGDEIILYFNPLILNELVDMVQIIDISNNKLSNEIKNLFKESGIPFNIIY